MPAPSCIFCGCSIQRNRKGRPATPEQLQQAAAYHHPHPVTATHICDTDRRHPPIKSPIKRDRSPSSSSSDTSSKPTHRRNSFDPITTTHVNTLDSSQRIGIQSHSQRKNNSTLLILFDVVRSNNNHNNHNR